ncbi:MAG: helix-turn-helix transcriptional regulator [Oligoflexia bacterium]|nr:helix-turn-helix transcriptional regulator [Oligoflexia bacterium]
MRIKKNDFVEAGTSIQMTPGEMIKTLRELKGWTQVNLAEETGISQANISSIENDKVEIGKQRSIVIARALNVHPASIMFADFTSEVA